MKLVLCVVIFVAVVQATAVDTQDEEKAFPDYWQDDDYDNFFDYDGLNNGDGKDTDKKADAEIQDFVENNEGENESFSNEEFDALGDYQFEDNRSNNDNKENDNDDEIPVEKHPNIASILSPDNAPVEPLQPKEDVKESDEDKDNDLYDEWWNELSKNKDLEENIESLEEVQEAVNEENSESKEDSYVKPVNEGNVDPDLHRIIDDTNKNLEGSDEFDSNADDSKNEDDLGINYDDDTPEKVLEDLSDDLDKLFETLDKLSDNDSDLGQNDESGDESEEVEDIQDYEEKYKRPYGEGYIMSLRDDYDNFLNSNFTDTSDESAGKSSNKSALNEDVAKAESAEVENNKEPVGTTKTIVEQEEVRAPVNNNEKSNAHALEFSDEIEKLSFDDSEDNEFADEIKRHYYGNDGLVDDDLPKNADAEVFLTASSTKISEDNTVTTFTPIENVSGKGSLDTTTLEAETIDKEVSTVSAEVSTPNSAASEESVTTTEAVENKSTMKVDELSSSEYSELMSQFAAAHKDELVQDSESMARNAAPKHITLSLDEPTVVTSPNHPNAYPSNIIMDWIIDGPGMGIEFNLTACDINGQIGDYLLVKPGNVNAEGSDGIIFSFTLSSVRRYRFTNVNRMFVRFQSHASWFPPTGFSFSAKMIIPPRTDRNEEIPEPEPEVEQSSEAMALSLAGLTLLQFQEVRSEFKELIADMAQVYIKENNIDPGLNTTLEVTQITRTAICNIRWPSYETCVQVSIGVPLRYAAPVAKPRLNVTELETMWRTYIVQEPFAARLRNLGITEYAIPNDSSIFMVWLLIASGVVIAMCLLAFALWRCSCFVDYTRMKTFSDTDSIQNEKRNLDLYPTPHQTLPPLYSESDYKWADEKYDDSTRVDLGGFANKSYIRDDLFDLDSDEDVIVPHDRKTVISPRDVYDV